VASRKPKPTEAAREFFRGLQKASEPAPVYLIHGAETFLVDMALDAVIKLALPGGFNDFNHDNYRGKETQGDKVVGACETLALFGGRRLVVVKDAQQISAAQIAPIADYLQDPSPATVLLIQATSLGRAMGKTGALYKRAKKAGVVQEFAPLREWEVGNFLRKQARKRGLTLDRDAEDSLVRSVGTDLQSLDTTLEKLDLYLGESSREVNDDVLSEVVAVTRTHQIWDFTRCIGDRDLGRSLELLSAMLEQGQTAVGINLMVARHFRQLWQVKCCAERGMDKRQTASTVGMSPWLVDKSLGAARSFGHDELRRILSTLYQTDLQLKSSRLKNSVLLERMVLDVCVRA
jgi:DNA polymerase III subunit delta